MIRVATIFISSFALCTVTFSNGSATTAAERRSMIALPALTDCGTDLNNNELEDDAPKRIKVGRKVVKLGMTVDEVSEELGSDWEDPVRLEKEEGRTVYRWVRYGETPGDKRHAPRRIITGKIRCTFKEGKLTLVIIDTI